MDIDLIVLVPAILGFMFIFLSLQVILVRRKEEIALGDGGNEKLMRAIKAQANFVEYTAIFLLMFLYAESYETPLWLMNLTGLAFIFARLLHNFSIRVWEVEKKCYNLRKISILTSFACIGALAANLLYTSIVGY